MKTKLMLPIVLLLSSSMYTMEFKELESGLSSSHHNNELEGLRYGGGHGPVVYGGPSGDKYRGPQRYEGPVLDEPRMPIGMPNPSYRRMTPEQKKANDALQAAFKASEAQYEAAIKQATQEVYKKLPAFGEYLEAKNKAEETRNKENTAALKNYNEALKNKR